MPEEQGRGTHHHHHSRPRRIRRGPDVCKSNLKKREEVKATSERMRLMEAKEVRLLQNLTTFSATTSGFALAMASWPAAL